MSKTKRNLNFLKRRHELTGFDSDYVEKLSESEAHFLEVFAREFYDGSSLDIVQRKAGNRRRYSAKQADAMGRLGNPKPEPYPLTAQPAQTYEHTEATDNLTPEALLILKEEIENK